MSRLVQTVSVAFVFGGFFDRVRRRRERHPVAGAHTITSADAESMAGIEPPTLIGAGGRAAAVEGGR
jgi:hypothetical protein